MLPHNLETIIYDVSGMRRYSRNKKECKKHEIDTMETTPVFRCKPNKHVFA